MWAAIQVLRGKRKPMSASEIYAEIRERSLAPSLKGKAPEQTVAAQLAVHAKRGLYVEPSRASSVSSAGQRREHLGSRT